MSQKSETVTSIPEGEAGQKPIVAFLSDPATHGGEPVTCVETHISRIFLAGDYAWKMKRALRTNYLDFSTLAQRERICRRELEVNAAAGDIYLGVVPVTREADGKLALGGTGTPVEWLVKMRRFDRERELDRLCTRGEITRAIAEDLADSIAAMHRDAPETPEFGDDADLDARIEQIAGALADAATGTALARRAEAWRLAAQQARRALPGLIAKRHRSGRIRRCHGDLHLGNVVMIGDRPTPFDAIEFSESIASIDVLYDIALTLADLSMRGEPDLANIVLNRYLGATGDYCGLALLPLFLSMRGAVRAMTAASRGDAEEAGRDMDFAEVALRPSAPPRLIAIGGLSGSGKSSVARGVAPRLAAPYGAVVIRSDVVRKRLARIAPEAHLPVSAYAPGRNLRVLARMLHLAEVALRSGATVILDATFLDPFWRSHAARRACRAGVPFTGIWLDLPLETAIDRVERRRADPSDATPDIVRHQSGKAPRQAPEDWISIPADAPLPEVVAETEKRLAELSASK